MKANQDDPRTRLRDLWSAWGINPRDTTADRQLQSLEPLLQWLNEGKPGHIVHAVQMLMLNDQQPGAYQRGCVKSVCGNIEEIWSNARAAQENLTALKAMVLSVWPDVTDSWGVAHLMDAGWQAVRIPAVQQERIVAWRRDQVAASSPTEIARPAELLDGDEDWPEVSHPEASASMTFLAKSGLNHSHAPQIASHTHSVLHAHDKAFEGLIDHQARTEGHVHRHEVAIRQLSSQAVSHTTAEVLWWGQARYCHTLRKPYRKLSSIQRLYLGALELCARAEHLDPEPTSAYFGEFLHAHGDGLEERKPLSSWLGELQQVIDEDSIGPVLKTIVEADAQGLAISALRAAPRTEISQDLVGLDLDIEMDRGDWAAWLYKEILLDRRLAKVHEDDAA